MYHTTNSLVSGFWLVSAFWIVIIISLLTIINYFINKKLKHKFLKYIPIFMFLIIGLYFHYPELSCEGETCGWALLLAIPCYVISISILLSCIIVDLINLHKNKKNKK